MTVYHVAVTGSDRNNGDATMPFRTITHATRIARAGDTVQVHTGTYREWVRPGRSGVTFEAAPGERPIIKGSEIVTGWQRVGGTVWSATVPNALFGDFNPFAEEVDGDWIVYPDKDTPKKHLGDVYLDGMSFFEATALDDVHNPARRTHAIDDWTGSTDAIRRPDQTLYVWYAEVDEACTTIWANFQEADPNTRLVEINVRRSVFYPTEHHVDDITVRGFELAQAASPWAPPTADQPGLIGPNWAKGWLIEDNIIHDAKCSALSLGKEASTGHNYATERGDKPGYQYQLESVFAARQIGWDKEHVGSHTVRRNTIFDCGQNGIVGHLGCVFSTIEDNHIYNIAIKREFYGYEIAGIKLHAAIDVHINDNRINDCTLGIWLDWETQGTRITRNLMYANSRDLFIEVSHGPYVVDHNILASRASLEIFSQGGAFVHNLICGTVSIEPVIDRPTPYHLPHSTKIAGYAAIHGGDDRYIGNIFLGGDPDKAYGPTRRPGQTIGHGTALYNGHPDTFAEYLQTAGDPTQGDHERFQHIKQPVYLRNNVYVGSAEAYAKEDQAFLLAGDARVRVVEEGEAVFLDTHLPAGFDNTRIEFHPNATLPPVRFANAGFENRDGTPIDFGTDVIGARKEPGNWYAAGPVAGLASNADRIRIW